MSNRTCYKPLAEVIEAASKRFGEQYPINKTKFDKLDEICKQIDVVVGDIECREMDIDTDIDYKGIIISLYCDELIFERGRSHTFFTLIKEFDSFGFAQNDEGQLLVMLRMYDIWERQ